MQMVSDLLNGTFDVKKLLGSYETDIANLDYEKISQFEQEVTDTSKGSPKCLIF